MRVRAETNTRKWAKALEDLHEVAVRLGVEVIYDKISGEGGFCRVHDKPVIVLNRIYSPQSMVRIFIQNLGAHYSLEEVYLSPLLRSLLEKRSVSNAS
ncbi:hypothetical protein JW890_07605 [candidate division WOR-3 bacterium]|nr:hypothetical protein [candidate division WOR-3 bacterium]